MKTRDFPKENPPSTNENEIISNLRFSKQEVLRSKKAVANRWLDLKRCTKPKAHSRSKVDLVFKTTAGYRQIKTIVWAVSEKNVFLSGGINIPIHCIHKVKRDKPAFNLIGSFVSILALMTVTGVSFDDDISMITDVIGRSAGIGSTDNVMVKNAFLF